MVKIASKNKGFTLLETLMAIVIISIGMMAIISAYNTGILFSSDIENTDIAINIAQGEMEILKSKSYTELQDDLQTDIEYTYAYDVDPSSYDLDNPTDWEIKVFSDNEDDDPMEVKAKVMWNVLGGQNEITLTTLVTDY